MASTEMSHVGEHHGEYGETPMPLTRATKLYAFCASINSCNLGYDIGVSTEAGRLVQAYFNLTTTQREMFIGCINFWASKFTICWYTGMFARQSTHRRRRPVFASLWSSWVAVFYRSVWSSKNLYCRCVGIHCRSPHSNVCPLIYRANAWARLCRARCRHWTCCKCSFPVSVKRLESTDAESADRLFSPDRSVIHCRSYTSEASW